MEELQKLVKEQGQNFEIHKVEESKSGDKKYQKVYDTLTS